jgi:hypothetical protein
MLSSLFAEKPIEQKFVPGKKVKYSVGPRVKTDGIMDNWLFYALIAIAAVAGIIAIDYFTSRKPLDEE